MDSAPSVPIIMDSSRLGNAAAQKSKSLMETPSGGKLQFAYAIAFSFSVMLLFLRAALFLCRIPFFTALSTAATAVL